MDSLSDHRALRHALCPMRFALSLAPYINWNVYDFEERVLKYHHAWKWFKGTDHGQNGSTKDI